jgi:hypothetical protein
LVCYLNPNKKYFAMKVEKNRSGNKSYFPLFEFDLDLNVWDCIGALQRK